VLLAATLRVEVEAVGGEPEPPWPGVEVRVVTVNVALKSRLTCLASKF